MWKEFVGAYDTKRDSVVARTDLKIDFQKPLQNGAEVVIHSKKGGLFRRRLDSQVSVKVIDDDHAAIVMRRPHEPIVTAGEVTNSDGGGFGYAILPNDSERDQDGFSTGRYTSYDQFAVTKQDVWIRDDKGRMHGVLWVNERGEREKPTYITSHRSYYVTDTDEEAQKVFAKIREREEKEADGRLQYIKLASVGGISVGLTFETVDNNVLPTQSKQ